MYQESFQDAQLRCLLARGSTYGFGWPARADIDFVGKQAVSWPNLSPE